MISNDIFKNENSGLIKLIFLIIIVVLVLSYFNFDIRSFIDAPGTQQNINYVTEVVNHIWTVYLAGPALYLWNDIFLDLLWYNFIDNMKRIKAGESHDFEINTPTVTAPAS